jgi:uncharacterized membrane protein YphA (DoxX/SURF4 family)
MVQRLVIPWLGTALRLLLAGVLGVAGALKVSNPADAVAAVRAYELLPESVERFVGYGLPFLEIALALLLLIGFATRIAAVAAGLLLLVFIAGIASAWARGLSIDCGCFGGGGEVAPGATNYLPEILRDAGLVIAAGVLVWRPRTACSVDRVLVPSESVGPDQDDSDQDDAYLDDESSPRRPTKETTT